MLALVNFDVGFSKNGQACEHAALLAYTLCETANCSCQHGSTLKPEVHTYIKKTGHNPNTVAFVPISSWNGENTLESSANRPRFKGQRVTHQDGGVDRTIVQGALDYILHQLIS